MNLTIYFAYQSLNGLLQTDKSLNSDATFKLNNPFHGHSLSMHKTMHQAKSRNQKERVKSAQLQLKSLKLNTTKVIFARNFLK